MQVMQQPQVYNTKVVIGYHTQVQERFHKHHYKAVKQCQTETQSYLIQMQDCQHLLFQVVESQVMTEVNLMHKQQECLNLKISQMNIVHQQ